ncbi:MAG: nucleotidyltransferase domain-containing protein [Armatimonadetes bacterium]|nr:nucleotidyltransferase domain-containing protein [Armatimonadota bacterium]
MSTASTREAYRLQLEPVTPELLEGIVRRIVAFCDPEKIILFGSYAHGTPREFSDVDLFIIKSGDCNRLDLQGRIDGLFWDMSLPLDVLVRTPQQVAHEVALRNPFIVKHVLGRGKVLYERLEHHRHAGLLWARGTGASETDDEDAPAQSQI